MATFSIRAVAALMTSAPAPVWRWTLLAGLLAQSPALLLVAAGPGWVTPRWLAVSAALITLVLTFMMPFAATAAFERPQAGFGSCLKRFLKDGLIAAVLAGLVLTLAQVLLAGQLLWVGAPRWLELGVSGLLGALVLVGLLRGSLWLNALAAEGGPLLAALRQSLRLTGPVALKLLLFWAGLVVLMILLSLPVTLFIEALANQAMRHGSAPSNPFGGEGAGWMRTGVAVLFIAVNIALASLAAVAAAGLHQLLSDRKAPLWPAPSAA